MRETVALGDKQYTLSTAEMLLHPVYSFARPVARFFLTSAMKYKLNHPEEDFVHIAKAFDPTAYVFFNQMTTTLYPKPNQRIPEWILQIINYFKQREQLASSPNHGMVVSTGEISPLQFNRLESDTELQEFYLQINPGYNSGDCLLTLVPLSLTNIGYGLKKLLSEVEVAH